MRALRVLAIALVASLIALGVAVEQQERELAQPATPVELGTPDASARTWFCAGGSEEGGRAAVALEFVNVGTDEATADLAVLRDDGDPVTPPPVVVPGGSRLTVSLTDTAPDSAWVGAVVETDRSDLVVEQTYDGLTGTDRASCETRTSRRLIAGDGATRLVAEGEELLLVLLNPFQEDAVADLRFDADVGPDRLDAVVVPAQRLVVIDVTQEVTVASRVTTDIEVRSGRLVAQRIQTRTSTTDRGLTVTPMVQDGAVVSVLPSVRSDFGLRDRITVTNPSADEVAEVDLEIVADGTVTLDPIELTVRPRRTVVVDIASESRVAAVPEFAVIARSLTGLEVAVGQERQVPFAGDASAGLTPGSAALPAADAASTTWIAALESTGSVLSVVNPSVSAIASVTVRSVGEAPVEHTFELGPGRRHTLTADEFGDRPLVVVEATAPVVVGREVEGLTSRQMLLGVVDGGAVSVAEID